LIEHFSHSSAHGSGVDHLHFLSLKFARKELEFIDLGFADNAPVVIEARRRDRGRGSLPGPWFSAALGAGGRTMRRNRGVLR
jgi:hypothetical protein